MHSTSSLFNGSSHCLDVANILNNDSPVRWVQADLEDDADETTSMMEQVDGENLLPGEPQGHGMYRCENGVTVCECHRPTPPVRPPSARPADSACTGLFGQKTC